MNERYISQDFEDKKEAIVNKVLQVLVKEKLTIVEAETVLHQTKRQLMNTKISFDFEIKLTEIANQERRITYPDQV